MAGSAAGSGAAVSSVMRNTMFHARGLVAGKYQGGHKHATSNNTPTPTVNGVLLVASRMRLPSSTFFVVDGPLSFKPTVLSTFFPLQSSLSPQSAH